MRLLFLSLALPLAGCLADVAVDVDPDGDGLADADEATLGSDPGTPDSDGDGFDDGDEASQHTNPIDAEDHPYLGGWQIGACRDEVEPTGTTEGEVSNNFELPDQFGEMVSFHDFCDQVVYVVFAAFW
jgi:hypothetical protein